MAGPWVGVHNGGGTAPRPYGPRGAGLMAYGGLVFGQRHPQTVLRLAAMTGDDPIAHVDRKRIAHRLAVRSYDHGASDGIGVNTVGHAVVADMAVGHRYWRCMMGWFAITAMRAATSGGTLCGSPSPAAAYTAGASGGGGSGLSGPGGLG